MKQKIKTDDEEKKIVNIFEVVIKNYLIPWMEYLSMIIGFKDFK